MRRTWNLEEKVSILKEAENERCCGVAFPVFVAFPICGQFRVRQNY